MTKVKEEVQMYQKPSSKAVSWNARPHEKVDTANSTSAFICGERLKKAVLNHPDKEKGGEYIVVNGKKYNIDSMLFRIDLLSKENTVLCYKLYQLTGLSGMIKGMTSPKRNLAEAEGKTKPKKKNVVQTV